MTEVPGSLDEKTDLRITKGYTISIVSKGNIELYVTDGFGKTVLMLVNLLEDSAYYGLGFLDTEDNAQFANQKIGITFILDGGPKLVSCVVQDRLYNGYPQGWKQIPRELGEIGGCNVNISDKDTVLEFTGCAHALRTSDAIAGHRAWEAGFKL